MLILRVTKVSWFVGIADAMTAMVWMLLNVSADRARGGGDVTSQGEAMQMKEGELTM